MMPNLRKCALILHVVFSVGWLGTVASFFALAVTGLMSQEGYIVQSAYVAMDVIAWYVILPLSLASLLSGLVQSLGTEWGLFRHYWVLAKFLITVSSTGILLTHMEAFSYMASIAARTVLSSDDLYRLRFELITTAGAAIVVLLVTTALSLYKPRGMTPYGRRKLQERRSVSPDLDRAA